MTLNLANMRVYETYSCWNVGLLTYLLTFRCHWPFRLSRFETEQRIWYLNKHLSADYMVYVLLRSGTVRPHNFERTVPEKNEPGKSCRIISNWAMHCPILLYFGTSVYHESAEPRPRDLAENDWRNGRPVISMQHCHHFPQNTMKPKSIILKFWLLAPTVASLGGRADRPGWSLQGRWHPNEKMWLNLQRIVDKRGRTGKKVRGDTLDPGGNTLVKWIKATVMTKNIVSFSGENKQGQHSRTDSWQTVMTN